MGDELAPRVERRSLDGTGWLLRGALGDEWRWADLESLPGERARGWHSARVPGSVLDDLERAGEIPDLTRDRVSREVEWVGARHWIYVRGVDLPAPREGERLSLELEGIDPGGRIFWDGAELARHDAMFMPCAVELAGSAAAAGRHVLAVVVDPVPAGEPQVGDTARVRRHRARMNEGWDFCPRIPHQGLWRPVRLRRSGAVRIESAWVRPVLAADHARAQLEVRFQTDATVDAAISAEVEISLDGKVAARGGASLRVPRGRTDASIELDLDHPAIWWPNGYGGHPVYQARIGLAVDGVASDEISIPFGVRSLRLAPNDTADARARPYRFVVNGVPMYVNGWNWVPIDARYGVPRPELLEQLLDLAQHANVNLLRVWGGGLIESEPFYAGCDARGILVWQEFAQSSSSLHNAPSDDPEFVQLMRREAAAIVPLRRTYPSLALWCGGNELMDDADRPLDESTPVLGALAEVVTELDPDRPFLPTSPSGPVAHNTLAEIGRDPDGLHDVHGPWEHQGLEAQHALYDAGTALFSSEFGVEGMTNAAVLEATISPGHRWPATRDNPVYAHRGAWWNNADLVQDAFGGRLTDLGTLRRASQLLQADGLRTAVEANRRRQWRSSGTIPWQLNEPFPNAWCTSAVDASGRPKPAYHAVASAYEPVHVAASFARQAWAGHERFGAALWVAVAGPHALAARLVARVVDASGRELARLERELELDPSTVTTAGTIEAPLAAVAHDLFVLDLRLTDADGTLRSATRYLLSSSADLQPLLDLPAASLGSDVERAGDAWDVVLRNDGAVMAAGVRLEDGRPLPAGGWATPDAGLVELLPGEERRVRIAFRGVEPEGRRLRVEGWNIAERILG